MWLWLKYAANSWFCKCCTEALPSALYSHWEKRKTEKEKVQLSFSFAFPALPWQRCFLFVFGYPELQSIFCFTQTDFSENHRGDSTYLGEHRPFQITVHMCRKHEFSGLYCVNVQLKFFKTKEASSAKGVKHKRWSRFGKRNFKRQHLQGETMNTTIAGFPIREYKVSLNVLPLGTM